MLAASAQNHHRSQTQHRRYARWQKYLRNEYSLAQVGLSPLTGSGNLWNWNPQARVEQRFRFGEDSGLREKLQRVARRRAHRYSLKAMTAGYLALYRSLLEPRATVTPADAVISGRTIG